MTLIDLVKKFYSTHYDSILESTKHVRHMHLLRYHMSISKSYSFSDSKFINVGVNEGLTVKSNLIYTVIDGEHIHFYINKPNSDHSKFVFSPYQRKFFLSISNAGNIRLKIITFDEVNDLDTIQILLEADSSEQSLLRNPVWEEYADGFNLI